MNSKRYLCLLTTIVMVDPLHAQEKTGGLTNIGNKAPFITGLEYLKPIDDDRQLNTSNIDLYYRIKTIESFYIYTGFTATRVTGEITQLTGSLQAGTLRQVTHESSARGIGPGILAKVDLFRMEKFSGALDVGGAFIVYDRDFPVGGTRYNFMWRIGPSLSYTIGKSSAIGVHYRWSHVSNGKDISSRNPSYDARGIGMYFSHIF